MPVPSRSMRLASQAGTRPPWSGRSAMPERFTRSLYVAAGLQAGPKRSAPHASDQVGEAGEAADDESCEQAPGRRREPEVERVARASKEQNRANQRIRGDDARFGALQVVLQGGVGPRAFVGREAVHAALLSRDIV